MGTSIDFDKVRRAFRKRLRAWEDRPAMAFENVPADPEEMKRPGDSKPGTTIEEILVPGPQPRVSTGFVGTTSIMNYMVRVPTGSGTKVAEQTAQRLTELFQAPQSLLFEDYVIKIERAEQMPGGQDGKPGEAKWYVVPVYVTFRLEINVLGVSP